MVRLTAILARAPVIKFRKGGLALAPASVNPHSNPAGGSGAQPHSQTGQAALSTGAAIPDTELPKRYQRQPLSQEEIDHINGGGIV